MLVEKVHQDVSETQTAQDLPNIHYLEYKPGQTVFLPYPVMRNEKIDFITEE